MNSTIFKNLFIGIFLLLGVCNIAYADEVPVPSKAQIECESFNSLGWIAYKKGNYSEALKKFTKAELTAKKNNLVEFELISKINIAKAFDRMSNLEEALKYFLEALEITNKLSETKEQRLNILSHIGGIYLKEKDYKSALKYSITAYTEAGKIKSSQNRFNSGIYISDIYNKLHNYKEARKYLNEIKDISVSDEDKLIWHITYAESIFIEGRVGEAQKIMEDIFKSINNKNVCYERVVELLSKIYESQNKIGLAILFAKKGLNATSELRHRTNLYDQLSGLYLRDKQDNTSLQYKDSIIILKDSLSKLVKSSFFDVSSVKFDDKDYQDALILTDKRHAFERKIYIVSLIFGIIAIFIIYNQFKNRFLKGRRENIILENKGKIRELELEKMKNNISEKNKKISAKVLYTSGRNELIDKILESLKNTSLSSSNEAVNNYINVLKSYVKKEEEWNELFEHFEKVNPGFLNALKLKHPDLSSNDIRFISYIYMGLSMDEISSVLSITNNACRVRKNRILEKMGQNKEDSLFDYIMKIG